MRPLLAALVVTLVAPVAAQTVWRCGPDGRSFQAVPCADGRPLVLASAPTAAAVAEARAVAAREQQALQTLAAQRRERERQAVAAAGFAQPADPAPRRLRPSSRPAPEGCGTAPSAARVSPRDPGAPGCS